MLMNYCAASSNEYTCGQLAYKRCRVGCALGEWAGHCCEYRVWEDTRVGGVGIFSLLLAA